MVSSDIYNNQEYINFSRDGGAGGGLFSFQFV